MRLGQSTGGAASATRCGQPMASAIGIRMSGGLACAIVAPSVNSTIEWITDCRCTTTSMRSKPMPNSRCASISSRPLLTSVAELIVMTGPMFQVGWASACCGGDPGQLVAAAVQERAAAGGQHQPALTSSGAPAAQALRHRGVLGVDRHELARARPAR